jgi:two-component system cell cycle sensor histidine kinase/response regulator CckA
VTPEVRSSTSPHGASVGQHRWQEALVTLTGPEVLGGDDLAAAFRRITEIDAAALQVARSSIWRLTPDRSVLVCLDLYDATADAHSRGVELKASDYPSYFAALDTVQLIDASDARRDPRTREFAASYLEPIGITSMMDVPFHVQGRVEGVVCREHVGAIREWLADEKTFAIAAANLVSLALAASDRRRAEATTRLLGEALNAAANAMMITDRDGAIEWVNPAFSRDTGYGLDEVRGRNPRDLVKSGLQESAHYAALWSTIQAGGVWRGELTNRRRDGSLYPVELTVTPIRGHDGRIGHFIAVQRDLTEEKRLEAQFLQAQKLEIVGRLAGGIAHDFNNLLTIINGTADLITMGLDAGHPMSGDLAQIKRAGERAASLTRQLLAFSRKQSDADDVLDLGALIADWRRMLQRLIGETIVLDVAAHADHGGIIKANQGQIEQILMNLAVNARDAMPDGGRLTVAVDTAEVADGTALTPAVAPGSYVRLSVTDTGAGIDAPTRERIFEPFFTTKEPGRGTGLGLATVYGIVHRLRGGIDVKSRPGAGTSFVIHLPAWSEPARPADAHAASSLTRGTETIAVVEDEEPLRALASRMLTSAGYTVLSAAHPVDALDLVRRHSGPLHLLLTDVVLPGVNGRELARRVIELRPEVAVLFTSGYTDDEIVRLGVLDRSAHFISKPYTAAALTRKVRALLEQTRLSRPA